MRTALAFCVPASSARGSVDVQERRIAAAITAGGHMVTDAHAPQWWTLADAEGNEVDIAPRTDDRD